MDRKAAYLAIVLILPFGMAAVEPVATLPSERTDTSAANLAPDAVAIIGGRQASGTFAEGGDGGFLDEVVRFDFDTHSTSLLSHLPKGAFGNRGRELAAATTLGSFSYVFGGAVAIPNLIGSTVGNVDPALAGAPGYVPASTQDVFEIDDTTGNVRLTLDRLPDPAWGSIAVGVPRASAAKGLVSACQQDIAIIIGGYHFLAVPPLHYEARGLQAIDKYDPCLPEGHRFTALGSLPYPVWSGTAVWTGSRVLYFGGVAQGAPDCVRPSCATSYVVAIDPATGSASLMSTRLPRGLQSPFAYRDAADRIIVGGGRTDDGTMSRTLAQWDEVCSCVTATGSDGPAVFGAPAVAHSLDGFIFGGRGSGGPEDLTDAILSIRIQDGPASSEP